MNAPNSPIAALAALLLALPFLPSPLLSAPAPPAETPASLEDSKKRLEEVEGEVEKLRRGVEDKAREERSLLGEIEDLDRELAALKEKVSAQEARARELAGEAAESGNRLLALWESLRQARDRLGERAQSLYKTGRVSYLEMIFKSGGREDLDRRLTYLRRATEHDAALAEGTARLAIAERGEKTRLEKARADLEKARKALGAERDALSRTRKTRALVLASVRDERVRRLFYLRELEAASVRLLALVGSLEEQARSGESGFPRMKGALAFPAAGRVIGEFGRQKSSRFQTYTVSKGLTIQSAEGTPVRAVYAGKAAFADWFRGFGRIVILDHGSGYYTLYGHLSTLRVALGEAVETDQVIGLVGDSGSLEGPSLYFEIRHHGKPVDPLPWLARRNQTGG